MRHLFRDPSHSFSVIKTIKIPGKSRKKENTVFVTWVNGWVVVTIVAAMGIDATDAVCCATDLWARCGDWSYAFVSQIEMQ